MQFIDSFQFKLGYVSPIVPHSRLHPNSLYTVYVLQGINKMLKNNDCLQHGGPRIFKPGLALLRHLRSKSPCLISPHPPKTGLSALLSSLVDVFGPCIVDATVGDTENIFHGILRLTYAGISRQLHCQAQIFHLAMCSMFSTSVKCTEICAT